MKRTKCPTCGKGVLRNRSVELLRQYEGKVFVFRQVPARMCDYCGERYFASNVVRVMDEMIRSGAEGIETIEAAVYEFPKEKEAA